MNIGAVSALTVSHSGLFLFSIGDDRNFVQINLYTKQIVSKFLLPNESAGVNGLQVTSDGKYAIAGERNGKFLVIQIAKKHSRYLIDSHKGNF
jgi:uncharacterized protein YjiK